MIPIMNYNKEKSIIFVAALYFVYRNNVNNFGYAKRRINNRR